MTQFRSDRRKTGTHFSAARTPTYDPPPVSGLSPVLLRSHERGLRERGERCIEAEVCELADQTLDLDVLGTRVEVVGGPWWMLKRAFGEIAKAG